MRQTNRAERHVNQSARIDRACESLRRERLAKTFETPTLETLMSTQRPVRGSRRPLFLALATLTVGGAAFGGYTYISRSWSADVTVKGKEVRVMLNGEPVPPDQVEWLPDGNCLVTVNGARILLDPRQPGGASASISVTETPEDVSSGAGETPAGADPE